MKNTTINNNKLSLKQD